MAWELTFYLLHMRDTEEESSLPHALDDQSNVQVTIDHTWRSCDANVMCHMTDTLNSPCFATPIMLNTKSLTMLHHHTTNGIHSQTMFSSWQHGIFSGDSKCLQWNSNPLCLEWWHAATKASDRWFLVWFHQPHCVGVPWRQLEDCDGQGSRVSHVESEEE